MAKRKTTMRDIAKDCNLSVATVSYVLNHSQKEKISHETRLKVIESATRLHYIAKSSKAYSDKSLSNLVGIVVNLKESNKSSKEIQYYDLAAELSKGLQALGFASILIPTKGLLDNKIIRKHNLDALFIIDVDYEAAKKFTKDFYVPILFLDCEINNPLFCMIYPNYPDIIDGAKKMLGVEMPFLVMEDIINLPLRREITNWFRPPDIFINHMEADLKSFLNDQHNQKNKGIVIGDVLGMQVERLFPRGDLVIISSLEDSSMLDKDVKTLYITNKEKAKTAINIFKNMIKLDYNSEGDNRVLLKSKP